MARPRRPEDPESFPTPCARCARHYQLVVTWPDGRLCNNCRLAAMRTTGTCSCGHTGVLPGRIEGRSACRSCSGVHVNIDCRRCGSEAELYRNHLCQRCVLTDLVDTAFADPRTGHSSSQLTPVTDALKAMDRPNSGLTWIRQEHVHTMLRTLVTTNPVTHTSLDTLTAGRTREYIRALLIQHGAAANVYNGLRIVKVCFWYSRGGSAVSSTYCSTASSSGSYWSPGAEVRHGVWDSLDPNAPPTVFNIQTTRINPNVY